MCVLHVVDGKTNEKTRVGFSCCDCCRAELLRDYIIEENLHNDGTIFIMRTKEGVKGPVSQEETDRAYDFVREFSRAQGWA